MISFEFYFEKWYRKTPKPFWFRDFLPRYLNRFALLVTKAGYEDDIKKLFVVALNELLVDREALLEDGRLIRHELMDKLPLIKNVKNFCKRWMWLQVLFKSV